MFPSSLFISWMLELQNVCSINAAYLQWGAIQRQWMMPPAGLWAGDPLNITDIGNAFDRGLLNEAYMQQYQIPNGSTGAVQGIAVQISYLSVMERSFRARHMTPVRAIAHAASRRLAQGEAGGIHTGAIYTYVQDLLNSGDA